MSARLARLALAAAIPLASALLASPPWWLTRALLASGRLVSPQRRLAAWDALQRRADQRARGSRRRVRVLLIRHGESEANLQAGQIVGGRDVATPLSATGEEQARLLGERLLRDGLRVDAVYASHAVRARKTADIACAAAAIRQRVRIEPRLVEFSQGPTSCGGVTPRLFRPRAHASPGGLGSLERRWRAEVYAAGGPVLRGIAAPSAASAPPPLLRLFSHLRARRRTRSFTAHPAALPTATSASRSGTWSGGCARQIRRDTPTE